MTKHREFVNKMYEAISENDIKLLHDLLTQDNNISHSHDNGSGFSPLTWAVYNNKPDAVQELIKNKADVDTRNAKGYAALHYANDPHMVEILLAKGADPNMGSSNRSVSPFRSKINELFVELGIYDEKLIINLRPDSSIGLSRDSNLEDMIEVIKLHIQYGGNGQEGLERVIADQGVSSKIPSDIQKILVLSPEVGELLKNPDIQKIKEASEDPTTGALFQANFRKRVKDELNMDEFSKRHLWKPNLTNDFIKSIVNIVTKIEQLQPNQIQDMAKNTEEKKIEASVIDKDSGTILSTPPNPQLIQKGPNKDAGELFQHQGKLKGQIKKLLRRSSESQSAAPVLTKVTPRKGNAPAL
ncbi:ankyrin repeat domain-containing protein [Candidatus Tisiphia endosymbiont of Nemotelus uliginosus]|uniref:ankyrin repeat domain-containing protein n=1 Tax=Candidatus Tisiphia endosymbiont of Nemotelus uliginosus TaxID=3077926 RepID=UPI0035C8BBE6